MILVTWLLSFVRGEGKLAKRIYGLKTQRVVKISAPSYWIHSASVGEYEQALPLIQRIQEEWHDARIVVTFFSASGYEWSQRRSLPYEVYYLPWDTPSQMQHFIDEIRPQHLILVKYELWANMIRQAKAHGAKIHLISARFYPGQRMLTWARWWYAPLLRMMDHIYVQDDQSLRLLDEMGIAALVSGDTRADRVLARVQEVRSDFAEAFDRTREKPLLILGSLWPEDWVCLEPLMDTLTGKYDIIIAPHEFDPPFMNQLLTTLPQMKLWTEHSISDWVSAPQGLMDAVGHLAELYRYADVAYVGGAFRQGLHNVFEPAAFGCPVLFGPETKGYMEADDLIEVGGAFSVADSSTLETLLLEMLDSEKRTEAGEAAGAYVRRMAGATDRIFHNLRVQ